MDMFRYKKLLIWTGAISFVWWVVHDIV